MRAYSPYDNMPREPAPADAGDGGGQRPAGDGARAGEVGGPAARDRGTRRRDAVPGRARCRRARRAGRPLRALPLRGRGLRVRPGRSWHQIRLGEPAAARRPGTSAGAHRAGALRDPAGRSAGQVDQVALVHQFRRRRPGADHDATRRCHGAANASRVSAVWLSVPRPARATTTAGARSATAEVRDGPDADIPSVRAPRRRLRPARDRASAASLATASSTSAR